MDKIAIKKLVESSRIKVWNQDRICMAPNCDEKAINSHVLQKNGILREISDKKHIYQFGTNSQFQTEKKGLFSIKSIGINDAYTFPGFCKTHDSDIFKPIELKNRLTDNLENTARLLSYRSLCNEIRRKDITFDYCNAITKQDKIRPFYPELYQHLQDYAYGLTLGQLNLNYFKSQLEEEIIHKNKKWSYLTCELPRFEVCLSGPLNIKDSANEQSMNYDSDWKKANRIFTTSVINFFPYKEKSYLMVAINDEYPCNWTIDLFQSIEDSSLEELKKHISDLISTRLEFWCMSSKVRNMISDKKYRQLTEIFSNEVLNFDSDILYNFNVFK